MVCSFSIFSIFYCHNYRSRNRSKHSPTNSKFGIILASLSVQVRRLHDTDKSGWWSLLGIIPLIGSIILLIMCVFEGTPGTNRFGEDPISAPENSNTRLENN